MEAPFTGWGDLRSTVIRTLADEQPLSAKKLFYKIRKERDVTYAGVHKALAQLTGEKVLVKENSDYKINAEWAKELKVFAEKLVEVSLGEKQVSLTKAGILSIAADAFSLFTSLLL